MIYLINSETKEVINTYNNALNWGSNFVEYGQGNFRAKIYCNDNEYFTDNVEPEYAEDDLLNL